MTNAQKFQETFGIYATEMWAMPEHDFLKWLNADTPQPDEIGDCNICRFAGCSECDDCINGSEWVRMVDYLEDVDDEQTDCAWK